MKPPSPVTKTVRSARDALVINRAPEEGEILRYDNAHEDEDIGWHHRHTGFGDATAIPFQNIVSHVARFLNEIAEFTDAERSNP